MIQIKATARLFTSIQAVAGLEVSNANGKVEMSEFGRMLEQEIPPLKRYARALTWDAVQAEDLVQDTLVRALAKKHLWQPGTNLRRWLFTILYRQRINDLRLVSRERRAYADERAVLISPACTSDPSIRVAVGELDRAIAALPVARRNVVLLVGLTEMSYDEAADILGVPIGTVRSRLARARKTLHSNFPLMGESRSASPRRVSRRIGALPHSSGA